ncbi:hypothetical protein B0H67DRAFT_564435 [Lasiosphaeris hirsuta]|uniref:mRNA 3'-end-processing protein n=1 Tax=Lasiosphaeris hirsuta TaxID=260670 RepID=A0AA40BBX2_9PEZI|nr:hypothetical protein B0H67DRAFT_564435 [Lasiosphaeris hirsuta]
MAATLPPVAAAPATTASNQAAQQMLTHATPHYTFSFTPFLQKTYQHSLPADRPVCKAHASGNCPLKSHCPDRHVTNTPSSGGGYKESGGFGSLVCKHWLRGLCKKGESCEFLHEYNLRKMPECNFFVRNGYCSNGDECLYLHIDPQSRLPPCPHYDRGFCPLGPRCDKKHVRRKLCVYYLAGFCPNGRGCKEGAHPRWTMDKDMEKPKVKEEKKVDEAAAREEQFERDREREREREREGGLQDRRGDRGDRDGGGERGHGYKERFGGRGGRWRGKGHGGRFRGRGGGH